MKRCIYLHIKSYYLPKPRIPVILTQSSATQDRRHAPIDLARNTGFPSHDAFGVLPVLNQSCYHTHRYTGRKFGKLATAFKPVEVAPRAHPADAR